MKIDNLPDTPTPADFALLLNEKLAARGISKIQLSRSTGLSVDEIYHLSRGDRFPSMRTVIYLAQGLECTPKDLVPSIEKSGEIK